MFGFVYDVLLILFSVAIGFYFFHRSKKSPKKNKYKIWGILSFVLVIIFIAISFLHNIKIPSSQLPAQSKDIIVDSAKVTSKIKQTNIKPKPNTEQTKRDTVNITNITSYDQQGGQTGIITNNFVVQPSQRKLQTDFVFTDLIPYRDFTFALHYNSDDKETVRFANNIAQCLISAKWRITSATGHSQDWSYENVLIQTCTSVVCKNASTALQKVLSENRIVSTIITDKKISDNFMYIRVGPNSLP